MSSNTNHFFSARILLTYFLSGLIFYGHGLFSPWFNICAFENLLVFPLLTSWNHLIHFFTRHYHHFIFEPEYHPATTFIYFLNARLGGDSLCALKLLNLVFIVFSAFLIFIFIRSFTKKFFWAFMAGLLFLTHPINVEPIMLPDMDADLFMTFFTLLVFISHQNFHRSQQNKWIVWTVIFYILALLAKETAIVVPFLILGFDLLLHEQSPGMFKKNKLTYALIGLVTLGYAALQVFVINCGRIKTISMINFGYSVGEAFRNLIYALEYLIFPFIAGTSLSVIGMLMTCIVFAVIFIFESKRLSWRLPTFCMVWILFALLPVLGILPIKQLSTYLHAHSVNGIWMQGRYLFLPAVGFCLFMVTFFSLFTQKKSLKFLGIMIFAAIIFCHGWASGLSIFSNKDRASREFSRVVSRDSEPNYSLGSTFFREAILSSIGSLSVYHDKKYILRVKEGLRRDFTAEQSEEIVNYFADLNLSKDPHKLRVFLNIYNMVKKSKDPREFWSEFIRSRESN